MNLNKFKKENGSVALLSVLIISAVLIIAVVSNAEIQSNSAQQHLNRFFQESLYYAAEACIEDTLIKLERDPDFALGSLNVGEAVCDITVNGVSPKNVIISVSEQNYVQNFSAQVSVETVGLATNVALLEWEET